MLLFFISDIYKEIVCSFIVLFAEKTKHYEVAKSLQRFLESSTIGEFEARLNLLKILHSYFQIRSGISNGK